MRKQKPFEVERVQILDTASEGKCVARIDNKVVFVEGAAPGDVVDLRITANRKKFFEGKILKLHEPSPQRVEPFCSHFQLCGGCKWQHLSYEGQLLNKANQVKDNLERIGKVALPEISAIMGAPKTQYYRNKLEFTFTPNKWLTEEEVKSGNEIDRRGLGFHIPGRFDRLVNIDHCYLQGDPSNDIRLKVAAFAKENGFSFYDVKNHEGLMRNLLIRSTQNGEWMVIVQFGENQPENIQLMMGYLAGEFPSLASLMYVINTKKNETFFDLEVVCFAGKDHIIEKMKAKTLNGEKELAFKIGPKSFFQTNSEQAQNLYQVTLDYAGLKGDELVYDLYTGTGTIANFVAGMAKKVVGLEYVPEAIEDAKVNSDLNGITNTDFFAGDIKDLLDDAFLSVHGRPDVIITDPPRAGMHADVVQMLIKASPEKIVYVSCNPATQARDLALLNEAYQVSKVQPVDMFPHTHHVENVVLLVKR